MPGTRPQTTPPAGPKNKRRPVPGNPWSEHLWSLAREATAGILLGVAEGKELTPVSSQFALTVLKAALPEKDWTPAGPAPRPIGRPRKEPPPPATGPDEATIEAQVWDRFKGMVVADDESATDKPDKEEAS